jgi:hypothetical protein
MITIAPGLDHPSTRTDDSTDRDRLQARTRHLLVAFAVLTALATYQLLVLGGQTDRHWAWTIEGRPTSAFLGAAYAAGFLLSVLALRQRSWHTVRIAVATVTVFTALTLVATILHAHKLHLDAPEASARAAAWFWLGVYLVVPAVCASVLLRQGPGRPQKLGRPLPTWLRRLLAGQGMVLGSTGALLFAGGLAVHHHVEPVTAFWPWPLMPLGSQIIGAWLIAFGVATVLVLRDGGLDRLRVPAAAYTAFGAFQLVVLVLFGGEATGGGASLWLYGAVLVSIVGAGGCGWWAAGSPVPSPPRPA